MTLHLAIDASRTTTPRVTGTEQYAIQLIRALIALNEQTTRHQIALYFRDQPNPELFAPSPYVTHKIIPFRRAWTHLRFAAALWQDRPDVTFVPAHTLPVFFPGRAVVTVHDLGFKYFPEAHPTKDRLYLDWTTRYSAARARVILADSAATAADLHQFYGTPAAKIRIVYPGVDAPLTGNVEAVRAKYGLPEAYFLFIGTLQPRKNITRIVQAYAQYRQQTASTTGLVLAGGKGWLFDPAWVEGVEGVHLPGYIDAADKGALLAGSTGLVFPSLYEGFGFPVLEAMLSRTPVIAANTSSLPELVGDAGLLVDPLDTGAIAEALRKLAENSDLRRQFIEKGSIQAAKFTWEAAASAAMQALEAAALHQ